MPSFRSFQFYYTHIFEDFKQIIIYIRTGSEKSFRISKKTGLFFIQLVKEEAAAAGIPASRAANRYRMRLELV
jgi:hypothetical protein